MLLFLVLQQLEGHIVAPQIFSYSLRINPLVVIFVLLLGGHLHGIVGALVALPLAAIGRETTMYLRRHLVLEPWGTPSASALREVPPVAERPSRRRCPECGTSTTPSAEFCFACGAPVRPQFRRPASDSANERPQGRRSHFLPAWPARGPHRPGRRSSRRTTPPERDPADTPPGAESYSRPAHRHRRGVRGGRGSDQHLQAARDGLGVVPHLVTAHVGADAGGQGQQPAVLRQRPPAGVLQAQEQVRVRCRANCRDDLVITLVPFLYLRLGRGDVVRGRRRRRWRRTYGRWNC